MPKMPPLSDARRKVLLSQPLIAKFATHGENDEIRITPMWFGLQDDGTILMNTWDTTDAAQNVQRNPKCSLLIDTTEFPYAGLHMWGTAKIEGPQNDAEAIGKLFTPYRGDLETAIEYAKGLIGYGIGKRVFIRFTPQRAAGWDFAQGG